MLNDPCVKSSTVNMLLAVLNCLLLISVSCEELSQSLSSSKLDKSTGLQSSTPMAVPRQRVYEEKSQRLTASDVTVGGKPRKKRNVVQLCKVLKTYTGNSCTDYNNYGCFCGLRSRGSNPVDQVDRCCRDHDRCYSSLNCRFLTLIPYSLQCTDSSCICTNFKKASCRYMACQCDIKLAECLQAARYNRSYKNYNTLRCH